MKLTRSQIKKIIIEEYLKETFITEAMSREKADEVIAWIKGKAPRPPWLTDDYGKSGAPKSAQAPNEPDVDRAADTMPFPAGDDIPADDAPERDLSGFQDRSGPPLEDQVTALVQDLQPEEMLDLFTAVIEKLAPEYIEPKPRQIGFREIKSMVIEALKDV